MKKTIITISGTPGSGKSTTAREVASKLGYTYFSSGDLMREMAESYSMTVDEVNKLAELNTDIDKEIDLKLQSLSDRVNLVIDSQLAFHWIPESFKVLLTADLKTASERTFNHIVRDGKRSETANSVEEMYKSLNERIESEKKRYKALYGIDYTEESNFDIKVDTRDIPSEEVIKRVMDAYTEWNN